MKKALVFLMAFAVIGTASAAFVNNGEFTDAATDWASIGGGGTWSSSHSTTGGNPGGYVTMTNADNVWNVWYQSFNEPLAKLGIPVGETVTYSIDIKEIGDGVIMNSAGLKAESWKQSPLCLVSDSGDQLFTVTTSWATYTYDYVLDPTADALKFVLLNVNYGKGGIASYAYDNARGCVGGKALYPVPAEGYGYASTATAVTWKNPAPKNPVDTVTATAYLMASATPLAKDPNMGPTVFDFPGSTVALTVTGESAAVTLADDMYYYWAVHTYDPNTGGTPKTTTGYTWDFQTFDSPPSVDAGADKYLTTDGSPMVVSLAATVVDDGTPAIAWTDLTNPLDKDPSTVVTITNATTATPTVTLTNAVSGVVNGFYIFQVEVNDGVNPAVTDTINVVVYPTCADAAEGDPNDNWDSTGDIDGNCKVELADFALMAANWLGCNTNRPADITCP